MHIAVIANVSGALIMLLGIMQLIPMGVSLAFDEPDWLALLQSAAGSTAVGGVMVLLSRHAREVSERDGFLVVTVGWSSAAVVGAVPYLLTGAVDNVADAMFESMSGFTTTGATIFSDLSRIGEGLVLWRSMTQWFGGMGIIVLALVILPALGVGGMQLYKREVPGPSTEKLTPRLRDTARALWTVYIALTVIEAFAYWLAGMTPTEAINHALTTVSTGGFSPHTDSKGEFESHLIEWLAIVFMLIGGINFALHYRLLTHWRAPIPHFRDQEFMWFISAAALASAAVSLHLWVVQSYTWDYAITKGTFQVVSIVTSTGYVSDDYGRWGAFPQMILLLAMIVGGCAGSTAGGVKWVRILLVFKYIRVELLRLLHPRAVVQAKLNQARVTPDVLSNIFAFIFLYLTSLAIVTLLLTLDGLSMMTAIGAAASALSNIGPGLADVGAAENYGWLSNFSKWVLLLAMLLGRLELMTVLVLFMPHVWRR